MYTVMVVERRNKYSPKTIVEPMKWESFEDLGVASSCLFRLRNLIGKHYDLYIINSDKK